MRWLVSLALAATLLTPSLAAADGSVHHNTTNNINVQGGNGGQGGQGGSVKNSGNSKSSSHSSSQSAGGDASSNASSGPASSASSIEGVYFPDFPGYPDVPNAGQPQMPKGFMNQPESRNFLPHLITRKQAETCREPMISDSWEGPYWWDTVATDAVKLFYLPPYIGSMDEYVGTSKVRASDKYSFMAALCEAAYWAMEHGATKAYVSYVVRPKNKTSGLGLGTSGGGMSAGAASANPYALAGSVGLGIGTASSYIEGELLLHMTVVKE